MNSAAIKGDDFPNINHSSQASGGLGSAGFRRDPSFTTELFATHPIIALSTEPSFGRNDHEPNRESNVAGKNAG